MFTPCLGSDGSCHPPPPFPLPLERFLVESSKALYCLETGTYGFKKKDERQKTKTKFKATRLSLVTCSRLCVRVDFPLVS